jgi:hypothetical protein
MIFGVQSLPTSTTTKTMVCFNELALVIPTYVGSYAVLLTVDNIVCFLCSIC